MIDPVKRVAVIGAGVSGITTAAHLKAEGVDVTVFERAPVSGGVCPCYETLTNNVATQFMELSINSWKPGTESFVRHNVLAEYIQDTAVKTGVHERIVYNTDVKHTVLLIGGSASSSDIAKELGPVAKEVFQSTRNGFMDHPESWLPPNGTRVPEVASFGDLHDGDSDGSTAIPGKVTLVDGQVLEGIDRVIIATGYLFTLPFASEFHHDEVAREEADDKVLVTDGTMLHNLHKDIFYIADPTLAFAGVPFYTATFSLFEFQAIAIAALFSGQAVIPSEAEMRLEYKERVKEKGYGKPFHTLIGQDVQYAAELMDWVNRGRELSKKKAEGYSKEWIAARDEFVKNYWKSGSKENVSTNAQ
ncbi:hypothetical protein DV737_g1351, partial [Chaetothyriales sp. CBS 132003]